MLTIEEKMEWAKKSRRYLEAHVTMCLSDLNILIPVLELSDDDDTYTTFDVIHVGLGGIDAEDEDELMLEVLFRIGHEVQHIRSTTEKAWNWAIDEGTKYCIRYHAAFNDPKFRFRKDSDYDFYLESLIKNGKFLDKNSIQKACHYIVNCLEDGRIERIRCSIRPGFRNMMIAVRSKEWQKGEIPEEEVEYCKNNDYNLSTALNQILFLSTMRIYQRGYPNIYEVNKSIPHDILTLIPHIKKGIESEDCRGCMEEGLKIINLLASRIVEAAQDDELAEILNSLVNSIINTMSENSSYKGTSRGEERGGENPGALFGGDALTIVVEQSEKKDGSGNSEDGQEKNGNASGNSSGKDGQEKEDGSGSASDSGSEKEEGSMKEASTEDMQQIAENALDKAMGAVNNASKGTGRGKDKESLVNNLGSDEVPDTSDINSLYHDKVRFREAYRNYTPDSKMPFEIQGRANTLKRKIQRIFNNLSAPLLKGRKNGKIDISNIHKAAMKQIDFFYKEANTVGFDGCCYLLADNSASMGNGKGSKRYYCLTALAEAEYAFSSVMALKSVAFDADSDYSVTHFVMKNWSETIKNTGAWNFFDKDYSGGGNKDGYSIRVATKELLARPEKKKLLFVFSDGLPYAYREGYPEGMKDVHEAVVTARSAGIEVVSIYFGENLKEDRENIKAFKAMYEKNYIIAKPEDISSEMVRILKRFCFR